MCHANFRIEDGDKLYMHSGSKFNLFLLGYFWLYFVLDISEGIFADHGHGFELFPLHSVLVFVVEFVKAFEHIEGVSDGLLIGEVFFENGEHLFLCERSIAISIVIIEGMQQFLLKLLLLGDSWLWLLTD